MKPITEYHNYRDYMRDFYEEHKRVSAFTWREFARLAGFVSPTYLKLVCDGKTRLSKPGVPKAAKAMGLEGFEAAYFALLVKFDHAKTDKEKKDIFEQMAQEAKLNKIRIVDGDAFRYYESPVCPILRELAPLMPGALPGELADKMDCEVSAQEVRDSLHFLEKIGMLKKEGDAYQQTSKVVTGSMDALPLAIRSMNREMALLAADSLEKYNMFERNISGLTMGINEETYARIVAEIDACRKRIVEIACECDSVDQVYRLNLQLFPLTSKVEQVRKCLAKKEMGEVMEVQNETK